MMKTRKDFPTTLKYQFYILKSHFREQFNPQSNSSSLSPQCSSYSEFVNHKPSILRSTQQSEVKLSQFAQSSIRKNFDSGDQSLDQQSMIKEYASFFGQDVIENSNKKELNISLALPSKDHPAQNQNQKEQDINHQSVFSKISIKQPVLSEDKGKKSEANTKHENSDSDQQMRKMMKERAKISRGRNKCSRGSTNMDSSQVFSGSVVSNKAEQHQVSILSVDNKQEANKIIKQEINKSDEIFKICKKQQSNKIQVKKTQSNNIGPADEKLVTDSMFNQKQQKQQKQQQQQQSFERQEQANLKQFPANLISPANMNQNNPILETNFDHSQADMRDMDQFIGRQFTTDTQNKSLPAVTQTQQQKQPLQIGKYETAGAPSSPDIQQTQKKTRLKDRFLLQFEKQRGRKWLVQQQVGNKCAYAQTQPEPLPKLQEAPPQLTHASNIDTDLADLNIKFSQLQTRVLSIQRENAQLKSENESLRTRILSLQQNRADHDHPVRMQTIQKYIDQVLQQKLRELRLNQQQSSSQTTNPTTQNIGVDACNLDIGRQQMDIHTCQQQQIVSTQEPQLNKPEYECEHECEHEGRRSDELQPKPDKSPDSQELSLSKSDEQQREQQMQQQKQEWREQHESGSHIIAKQDSE